MKILKFFLFTAALFIITACSSDDAPAFELNNANVAGTYNVVFLESEIIVTTEFSGSTIVAGTIEAVADTFTNAVFTFNEDGTYSSTGSYRITTTIDPAEGPTTTESIIESFDDEGTYSTNNSARTITIDGDTGTVTLFNSSNLRVIVDDVFTEDGSTFTSKSEIRLERQN